LTLSSYSSSCVIWSLLAKARRKKKKKNEGKSTATRGEGRRKRSFSVFPLFAEVLLALLLLLFILSFFIQTSRLMSFISV
ncbi:hypothetical protein CSUI_005108, partial [Cystoisospora suis]